MAAWVAALEDVIEKDFQDVLVRRLVIILHHVCLMRQLLTDACVMESCSGLSVGCDDVENRVTLLRASIQSPRDSPLLQTRRGVETRCGDGM